MRTCTCKDDHGISSTGVCPNCGGDKPLSQEQQKLADSFMAVPAVRKLSRLEADLVFSTNQGPNYVVMTSQEAVKETLAANASLTLDAKRLREALDMISNMAGTQPSLSSELYLRELLEELEQIGRAALAPKEGEGKTL
jgi:hypothetical protein